ncbi:MAG TPA: hypothetical protein VFN02_00625 [Ktedonobacteraceae bacterium]|nr:hypothetical protein [Ktedonobacteraceae bacterium]
MLELAPVRVTLYNAVKTRNTPLRPTTRLSSPLSRERTGAGVTLTRLDLRLLERCYPGSWEQDALLAALQAASKVE